MYGDTTTDQADAAAEAARADIAFALSSNYSIEVLANRLVTAAEQQGARLAVHQLVAVAVNLLHRDADATDEDLADHLDQVAFTAVVQGADDRWSGRTNDIRRAEYDGKRAMFGAAREIGFSTQIEEARTRA